MSDSEDADLENLRQAALSSLLRKKSTPLQTNAVFYRPVSNSNLISIQPLAREREEDENDRSDCESSSGSEYAVIEEGLSVSSGDVDQVIEEIIVSDPDSDVEDAISMASNDSFDEILNSVEEEIRDSTTKKRSAVDTYSGPLNSKRPRPDIAPESKRKYSLISMDQPGGPVRSRSPSFKGSYHNTKPSQPLTRRSRSPNYFRSRNRSRSKSPNTWTNRQRRRSPDDRRTSKSPIENRKPRSTERSRRKSLSPTYRRRVGRTHPQPFEHRRPRSRNSRSRSTTGSDKSNKNNKGIKDRRTQSRRSRVDQRRSKSRSPRSRSPRNKLSFGDHRLRSRGGNKISSTNSSRHQSRERNSRSPTTKRKERSKSPASDRKQNKGKSSSPQVDTWNLSVEERERLEKRKLKFQSKVSHSGKVILKPKENSRETDSGEVSTKSNRPSTMTHEGKNSKPKITERLGRVMARDKKESKKKSSPEDRGTSKEELTSEEVDEILDDASNNNSEHSTQKNIEKDDLRTKLQQKRAANVGRIFTVALKDTFHKEKRSSTSPRS